MILVLLVGPPNALDSLLQAVQHETIDLLQRGVGQSIRVGSKSARLPSKKRQVLRMRR